MPRYIDADLLMPDAEHKGRYDVVSAYDIANTPTADVVPRKVVEQIKWERDTAVEQLEELGYGLGEKINKYDSKLWIPCDKELPKNDERH